MVDKMMEISEEDFKEALEEVSGVSSPSPKGDFNAHKFLHDVLVADDTTKVGFLKDEELGTPNLPVRTHQELSMYCEEVADMGYFKEYFAKLSEITTSTSLSRNAKLLDSAVTTKRSFNVGETPRKENKGWFSKKPEGGEQQ